MRSRTGALTVAVVALFLGVLVVSQFRSREAFSRTLQQETPETLTTLIADLSDRNRQLRDEIFDLRSRLEQARSSIAGGRGALGVLSATACAGIIIGVVTLTGLGLKLGSSLVALADGQLFMTLVFTMVTSIILGMGVPTTANYVITSTIAAPAIILILRGIYPELGDFAPMIVLPAHMFAFYFGIIADVTPPVALAAFAGAGIAKANPMKTGLHASKLAVAAFMVPYIFVYNPQMLLFNVTPVDVILMVLTSVIGIVGVSAGVMGYFRRSLHFWERPIFLAGGVLMVMPGVYTDLIGLTVLICGYVLQRLLKGPVVRQKLAA